MVSAAAMVQIFCARSAALRPGKPKPGFYPNTRKSRVLGAQTCREQLRADLHPATRKPRVSGTPGLRRKEMFYDALAAQLRSPRSLRSRRANR